MSPTHKPAHDPLADEWLVVRCQLGERPAFDELIARWQLPLWRYARQLAGSDVAADDVSQEVWLRALRGIARLRDGAKLRPWLFGIAHRVLMDRLREQFRLPLVSEGDIDLEAMPAVDDDTPDVESELAALRDGLARLPTLECEVLTLFYLRELSLDEVAQVLAVPLGTVKSRLYRARRLLRRQLGLEGERG
ncbi:sigma-70 family RNA polymerase sigma factor [Pelomonas sp. V22]|uniref:RNA polymerase sigma factor n=1 Tax=Pelomonas sp. V22 TaxID=2822139 RepID=UPI0024A81806|nr:sigma-70 family RNA polymerase sigma factor [Pelomonas sp. V22]MDI4635489.1 sigma-70 family RNA polymerase sigma factor [Pelomonas sp. V22]